MYKDGLKAGETVNVQIGGVRNPRSFKPTDGFVMKTYDQDHLVSDNEGFLGVATMTEPIVLDSRHSVKRSNVMNGKLTDVTFDIQFDFDLQKFDQFVIELPDEVKAPNSREKLDCQPLEGVTHLYCTIEQDTVTVQLKEFDE
jgi:hypothetical protein